METLDLHKKPSIQEQKIAIDSYKVVISAIEQLKTVQTEIKIEENQEKIVIPVKALKLLADILKSMSEGLPISIVPIKTEVTTQKLLKFWVALVLFLLSYWMKEKLNTLKSESTEEYY